MLALESFWLFAFLKNFFSGFGCGYIVRFATEKYSLDPAKISDTRIHVTNFDVNKESVSEQSTTPQHLLIPEVVFKEKCGVRRNPMLELTKTSPCLIIDSEVQLFFHPNDDDCRQMFPQLFKNGATNRKRKSIETGGEGVGAHFMS
jgi:hypothetical protein